MTEGGMWWVNGELIRPEAARLPVIDHGFTVGDGCFEATKIVRGEPFALTRHLRRLRRSLTTMGIDLHISDEEIRAATGEVITASPDAGVMRITVTAGPAPLGSLRGDGPATLIVAAVPDRGHHRRSTGIDQSHFKGIIDKVRIGRVEIQIGEGERQR